MRGIVGAPRTEELGNVIAGKDEFKFSLKLDIKDLKDKCKMILKRFNSDKYKENYDWYDHLKAIEDPPVIGKLKNRKIYIHRDNEDDETWKVYNCIIFEQTEDQTLYILTNGNWFEVDNDFVKEVDQYLEEVPKSSIILPDYDHDNKDFSYHLLIYYFASYDLKLYNRYR